MQLSYVVVAPAHRFEVISSLTRSKSKPLLLVCTGNRQKVFYEDVALNWTGLCIQTTTLSEYLSNIHQGKLVILIETPHSFDTVTTTLKKASSENSSVLLILLDSQKKYVNMVSKKIENLTLQAMSYSPNKFIGANDKLRQLIEESYDLNRKAFYAYGEYLEHIRTHPLQRIFHTSRVAVTPLALSFGFVTPPRVKEGKFLQKVDQQAMLKKEKKVKKVKKEKKVKKVEKVKEVEEVRVVNAPKTKGIKKEK